MGKLEYNPNIYVTDIETTDIEEGAVLYLGSMASINLSDNFKNINYSNIEEKARFHGFYRTYNELDEMLIDINNSGYKTVIFIHNLAYEWTFFYKNSVFCHTTYDDDNSLYTEPNKPLKIACGNIEFRDSARLLNASLRALGERLGYKKLDIDYSEKYFWFSELPEVEYEYNRRDCFLTLLAIVSEYKKYDWICSLEDALSVYTYTSFTRKNNLKEETINKKVFLKSGKQRKESSLSKLYLAECRRELPDSKETVEWLEDLFCGAFVAANPSFVGVPVKRCMSFDFGSSYPASTVQREFPYHFVEYNAELKETVRDLHERNITYNMKYGKIENGLFRNWRRPVQYYFMAEVVLKDVKIKRFFGKDGKNKKSNQMALISESKTDIIKMGWGERIHSQTLVINGRVFSAKRLELKATAVDLLAYSLFYDFEIEDCKRLFVASQIRKVHEYLRNTNYAYLNLKANLKPIHAKTEEGKPIDRKEFYKDGKPIMNEENIEVLMNLQKSNYDEFAEQIHELYMQSKGHLNGQYGINVEKILKDDIHMDWDDRLGMMYSSEEADFNEIKKKGIMRNFIVGLHITAFSRLSLAIYTYCLFVHTNAYVIYWDTDSIKVHGDEDGVRKVMKQCYELFRRFVKGLDEWYNIGAMDEEPSYDWFCTWGAKKYIVLEGDSVKCTISGVNKRSGSKMYTYFYHTYCDDNFERLCKMYFRPNVIIDRGVTSKLASIYGNARFDKQVCDKNGTLGWIHEYSGVQLVGADYTILATNSKLNSMFLYQLLKFQKDSWVDPRSCYPIWIYKTGSGYGFEYRDKFEVKCKEEDVV